MIALPSEREPWLERRQRFNVLVIRGGAGPHHEVPGEGVTIASPLTPLHGHPYDLVVVPAAVQRDYKLWVEEVAAVRMAHGGRMIIVEGD